jgi:hypothetical protein
MKPKGKNKARHKSNSRAMEKIILARQTMRGEARGVEMKGTRYECELCICGL